MNFQNKIKAALLTVGVPVSHFAAAKQPAKYIVWAEDMQASSSVYADNVLATQVIEGTIDYYTKTEYDSNVDKLQSALASAGISYRLNSIQHEVETGYIHYEWVWDEVAD